MQLHIPAVRFPVAATSYVGIDPPEEVTPRSSLEEGERLRGTGLWADDLYGVGDVLGVKRETRGWDGVMVEEIERSLKEDTNSGSGEHTGVRGLLRWQGGLIGKTPYPLALPWDKDILDI